jgi:hypothetical protein
MPERKCLLKWAFKIPCFSLTRLTNYHIIAQGEEEYSRCQLDGQQERYIDVRGEIIIIDCQLQLVFLGHWASEEKLLDDNYECLGIDECCCGETFPPSRGEGIGGFYF